MSTWIERYAAGEHTGVWDEMQALGAKIGEPKHRTAADKVVQETVKRARGNVLWLLDALAQLGYQFTIAAEAIAPDYPLELRIQGALAYVRAHGGPQYAADPWSHPALAWVEEEEIELPGHHRGGRVGRGNYLAPDGRTGAILQKIEKRLGGPLSLALRAWFETVGCVDLTGTHPILNPRGSIETLRVDPDSKGSGMTAGVSAGAGFVASVRHAFVWAGFPGWSSSAQPPERELAWLRTRLLPL